MSGAPPLEDSKSAWLARVLKSHPDVLELRETLRPLQPGSVSFARDHTHCAHTESSEALPPASLLCLVLEYLHEQGYVRARDSLLREALVLCPELWDELGVLPQDGRPPEFSEELVDPAYVRGLLPLLQLGVKDAQNVFSGSVVAGGDNEDGDAEVEAAEDFAGYGELGEEASGASGDAGDHDISVWEEASSRGAGNGPLMETAGTTDGLVAGTVNQIVIWITQPGIPISSFESWTETLLLMYPTFVTAEKLAAKLIQRCHVPESCPQSERGCAQRALALLTRWIELYPRDFVGPVLEIVTHFVKTAPEREGLNEFRGLSAALEKIDTRAESTTMLSDDFPKPKEYKAPCVPQNIFSPRLALDDIDEMEISIQLSLLHFRYFWRIQSRELIGCAWRKGAQAAPNVTAMINRQKSLTQWVMTCILWGKTSYDINTPLPQTGAPFADIREVYCKFSRILYYLTLSHDYFGAWGVYLALSHRLIRQVINLAEKRGFPLPTSSAYTPQSQKQLGSSQGMAVPPVTAVFTLTGNTFSPSENFKNYREGWNKSIGTVESDRGATPLLFVHLADLSFIEDSMPGTVGAGQANFRKAELEAKIIKEFLSYKQYIYSNLPVAQIMSLLEDWELPDEKVLQERALQILK